MATEEPIKFDPTIVTDDELRESYSGPASLSNRMLITKTPAGVRLTFMEIQAGKVPSVFRTAVLLSYQDAIALRDLITDQLKEIEAQLKDVVPEAEKKAVEVPSKNG